MRFSPISRTVLLLLISGMNGILANSEQHNQEHNIKGFDGQDSNYYNIHESTQQHFSHGDPNAAAAEAAKTKEEEIFYFFSLHDYNKDHHLDGHELALAFQGYEYYNGTEMENVMSQSDLEFMIDNSLEEDDLNNDGKISWAEYLASQQYHHQV